MKKLLLAGLMLLFFITSYAQKEKYSNRILVIGGGGQRGAWGGGYAEHLTKEHGAYRVVFGTSTGSLLAPLVVLNDFKRLRDAYTTVDQKGIFNKNPFKSNGDLRPFYAIRRVIAGKESFGETWTLRHRMDKFFDSNDYKKIKDPANHLVFSVAVANMTTGKVQFGCSDSIGDLDEMKDWMWASANEPLFMNYVYIKGYPCADGGVMCNVPLLKAVEYAKSHPEIDTIDVIINKPEDALAESKFKNHSIFSGLLRLIELWSLQIRDDNILIGKLQAIDNHTKARETAGRKIAVILHYYPSYLFDKNRKELLFNEAKMQEQWASGLNGEHDGLKNFNGAGDRVLSIPIDSDELDRMIEEEGDE